MFNLFVSYFNSKEKSRQLELETCLKKNIQLNEISNIFVLVEEDATLPLDEKVIPVLIKSRPTYNNIFQLIKERSNNEDWNIIANSDIYFDHTILQVEKYKHKNPVCFALCRWEVKPTGVEFLNRRDSQDCWIFKGHPREVKGDFNLGMAGCDNAIADRFWRAGYEVVNPSKTIKTYHLHQSNIRTYNENDKVPQPYKLLSPTI